MPRGRPKKNTSPETNPAEKRGVSQFSPYMLLNAWFRDGSKNSPLPKELEESKAFAQTYILYYFQSNPKLFIWINKVYNNFNLFAIPVNEILKTMKEIIRVTGYRQPFVKKAEKETKNQLCGILKKKYVGYKPEEISMAVDLIDKDEELQSIVYETFGIREPGKSKTKKNEFKQKMESILSKESLLNDL